MTDAINETLMTRLEKGYYLNEEALKTYEPDFDIRAGFCSTYTDLLLGECGKSVSSPEILDQATKTGRVILSDRGGSGKTVYLRRLMAFARASDFHCLFLDLSKWKDSDTQALKSIDVDMLDVFNYLLGRFCEASFDAALLEALGPDEPKLIIVDGLNETPGRVAESVLSACDVAANTYPSLQVIASDRLIRRELDSEKRWAFLHLFDLERTDVDRILEPGNFTDVEYELMRSPFFVEQQRKGNLASSRIETIKNHITTHGSVGDSDIRALSKAAFVIYKTIGSRTFPASLLTDAIDQTIISELLQSQILIAREDGQLCFAHHWMHDCLASLYVSQHEDLWSVDNRYDTLDALTFKKNSFDAVGFVLQALDKPSSALFLQAVYDWNPYAAGYALSDVDNGLEGGVAKDVRTIVLAMLALRKLDRQVKTAEKAADALNLFRDELAVKLRSAASIPALKDIVADINIDTVQFKEWKSIFCQPAGSIGSTELVGELSSENSINGWTASNIVKELEIEERALSLLFEQVESDRSVVRWRAAHALGSVAQQDVVEVLFRLLSGDAATDVRFGAIRSLMEIASSKKELARQVIDKILPQLGSINEQAAIVGELESSLFVKPGKAYDGWEEDGIEILNGLIDEAGSVAEIEKWADSASRLRVHGRQRQPEAA